MSDEKMNAGKIERFCANMVEHYGVIITPQQARALLAVPDNKTEQVAERFRREAQALRDELPDLLRALETRLSGFLRPETLDRKRSDLSLFLSALLADLRPSDVRTEVLASWLVETETSDSSSAEVGESTGEVPASRCSKIVLRAHRVASLTFDPDKQEYVITLRNGGA